MAKKKDAKTAKKAAKKKLGGAASGGSFPAEESGASFVVVSGAEAALGLVEVVMADTTGAISVFPVSMPEVSRSPNDFQNSALLRLREDVQRDKAGPPYLRVVGRVVYVLTVHRREAQEKSTCSAGDVFRVFLEEIPQHSPYSPDEYRLATPSRRGNEFDVTRDPGRTTINKRLNRLKAQRYVRTTKLTVSGEGRGYVLTADGVMVFSDWPEVAGLELNQPSRTGQ